MLKQIKQKCKDIFNGAKKHKLPPVLETNLALVNENVKLNEKIDHAYFTIDSLELELSEAKHKRDSYLEELNGLKRNNAHRTKQCINKVARLEQTISNLKATNV